MGPACTGASPHPGVGPGGDDSALVELHDVRHLAAEHPELVAVLLDDSHTLLNELALAGSLRS